MEDSPVQTQNTNDKITDPLSVIAKKNGAWIIQATWTFLRPWLAILYEEQRSLCPENWIRWSIAFSGGQPHLRRLVHWIQLNETMRLRLRWKREHAKSSAASFLFSFLASPPPADSNASWRRVLGVAVCVLLLPCNIPWLLIPLHEISLRGLKTGTAAKRSQTSVRGQATSSSERSLQHNKFSKFAPNTYLNRKDYCKMFLTLTPAIVHTSSTFEEK